MIKCLAALAVILKFTFGQDGIFNTPKKNIDFKFLKLLFLINQCVFFRLCTIGRLTLLSAPHQTKLQEKFILGVQQLKTILGYGVIA